MKKFMRLNFWCFLLIGLSILLINCNTSDDISSDTELVVSPKNAVLTKDVITKIFLSSSPVSSLEWQVGSKPDWLSVTPSSGVLGNQLTQIDILPISENLIAGSTVTGTIEFITVGAGKISVEVEYFVEIPPVSQFGLSTEELVFDYNQDTGNFQVINGGEVDFVWNLNNTEGSLNFSIESGMLKAGGAMDVNVLLDRSTLETDLYEFSITFSNDQDQTIVFPISVKNFKEEKWLFNEGLVIDAEYDRVGDKLLLVTSNPNQLRKLDPVSEYEEILNLNMPPNCISISQDGKFAAVGHDARVSYINLETMQLLEFYSVTADVFDVVLAPNNFVYAFPRTDQHERIRCLDLSNGVETLHTGNTIYAGTRGKLHPSGSFIYGANNGLSPSDVEKYDISEGTAQFLYDSPYHGDFDFDGNLWLSEDGEKLIARSGNIFNTTIGQQSDLTYNGKLIIENQVRFTTVDFHKNANLIYGISDNGYSWANKPGSVVRKYTADFYNFNGEIPLPKFLGTDIFGDTRLFDAEGHYGFFNNTGSSFYVLVKSNNEENTTTQWGLVTIETE
ncbi:BACON domain-containing protein [Maribacter spongiicola]|nr:hypothetical protein [Maribacter spongiicola]